jgi:hypothetical protein
MSRISIALALVVLVCACGGDGDADKADPASQAPIPPAFTEKVASICRDMRRQIFDLGRRPSRTKDESGYLAYTSDVSAVLLDGNRQFRSLPLPRGDAGTRARRAIDETVRRVERFDVVSEDLLTAVTEHRGERAAEQRYEEALTPELHAPLRDELGARRCSFEMTGRGAA